jgi:hypothetical protein
MAAWEAAAMPSDAAVTMNAPLLHAVPALVVAPAANVWAVKAMPQ